MSNVEIDISVIVSGEVHPDDNLEETDLSKNRQGTSARDT